MDLAQAHNSLLWLPQIESSALDLLGTGQKAMRAAESKAPMLSATMGNRTLGSLESQLVRAQGAVGPGAANLMSDALAEPTTY